MTDRRRKNVNWNVADENGQTYPNLRDGCSLAVLMDIRDELQALNSKIDCYRVRDALDAIARMNRDGVKIRRPRKRK